MAFVAVALPAIGSLASAALPALGTAATGIGSALGSLPVVGSALSGLGSGLGSMFTGLGGASGIPALTGTLGAGGGLGGMLGLGGGGAGGGGGLFGQGGLKNLFQPGTTPGVGGVGGGGLPGGLGGLLGQGGALNQLANSPLVKGINTVGTIAGAMDPGGASYSNVGTLGGPAAGTAGGATAANIQPNFVARPAQPGAIQYGTQPGVLNFAEQLATGLPADTPGYGSVLAPVRELGDVLKTDADDPDEKVGASSKRAGTGQNIAPDDIEVDVTEPEAGYDPNYPLGANRDYYAEEAERNKKEYVADGEWKIGDDWMNPALYPDQPQEIGDTGEAGGRPYIIVGKRADGTRVIDYTD